MCEFGREFESGDWESDEIRASILIDGKEVSKNNEYNFPPNPFW
jgi:hypothetical protein